MDKREQSELWARFFMLIEKEFLSREGCHIQDASRIADNMLEEWRKRWDTDNEYLNFERDPTKEK